MTSPATTNGYGADDLVALEGLEAVRKRPGMYIGSTDSKGLTHLVYEIVDNSVDEALAGHCGAITVTLHTDGSVEVEDNGRGIPTDINAKTGLSGVEMVLTKLHAGGKFGSSGYKSAGGLHGVGASVVNALSIRLDATVDRAGKRHVMSFSRGVPGTFAGDGGAAKFTPANGLKAVGRAPKGRTGTTVRFWPDMALFKDDQDPKGAHVRAESVFERLKRTAFLVPNLAITVRDLTGGDLHAETFQFAGGIADMVDTLATDQPVIDTVRIKGEGKFTAPDQVLDDHGHLVTKNVEKTVEVDIALRWGTGYDSKIESFVNVVHTPNGGTHVKGFERALLAIVNDQLKATRVLKKDDDAVILDDCTEGLTAVVSVNIPEPQFVGQTKDELGTPGALKIVRDVASKAVKDWAEARKTKTQARVVLEKVAAAQKVRVMQRQQKDAARRKTALETASMPSKLVDCRSGDTTRTELWICEGDSALGTARAARSSEFQALLPIRGKILNVQKADLKKVLDNSECASIIQVVGAGSGRTFDLDSVRYQRIILASDADVDGSHIRCLLITLFARYMRPLIESGRLFTAVPPLHKIEVGGRDPQTLYTYSVDEMTKTVAKLEKAGKTVKGVARFKGLGEMDASEFADTTMNPVTRTVRRITMSDVTEAETKLELLMGEKVAPRYEWLMASARKADLETAFSGG